MNGGLWKGDRGIGASACSLLHYPPLSTLPCAMGGYLCKLSHGSSLDVSRHPFCGRNNRLHGDS